MCLWLHVEEIGWIRTVHEMDEPVERGRPSKCGRMIVHGCVEHALPPPVSQFLIRLKKSAGNVPNYKVLNIHLKNGRCFRPVTSHTTCCWRPLRRTPCCHQRCSVIMPICKPRPWCAWLSYNISRGACIDPWECLREWFSCFCVLQILVIMFHAKGGETEWNPSFCLIMMLPMRNNCLTGKQWLGWTCTWRWTQFFSGPIVPRTLFI